MAVYIFYYIWWTHLKELRKSKLNISILKQEFIVLFYFQKLYNLLYQYQLLRCFSTIYISIYRGEWESLDSLLGGELESLDESYFWELYTVKGEEEFWKSIGIEPKSMMGVIKKKIRSYAVLEVDEDEDTEEKVEESKRIIAKKVRKQPNEEDLIPTWTVPAWLHYKQRYKLFPIEYDLDIYFSTKVEFYKPLFNFLYFKEISIYFLKNLSISLNSFWLLRFLSLYTKYYTQNKVSWVVTIPTVFKSIQNNKFLVYYKIFLLIPRVHKFIELLEDGGFVLLYMLLMGKHTTLFITWVTSYLKTLSIKYYKRFLRLLKNFLDSLVIVGRKYQLIYGYQFIVRGKLMGTGSTRKKHLAFHIGQFSLSSKQLSFNYKKFIIRTSGGVISGEFRLFFKICLLLQFYIY